MSKKIFGDSVPSVELVRHRGSDVETRGLGFEQIIDLVCRFPSIVKVLDKGKPLAMTEFADPVINIMIAMATGVAGDEEQEANIANLKLGERAAFMASIIRQTAPDGVGPFVDLLNALSVQQAEEEENKNIKVRLSKSPELQQNSATQATAEAA